MAPFISTDAGLSKSIDNNDRQEYYSSGLRARFLIDANKASQKVINQEPEPSADIGYYVNEEAFKRRSQKSLARRDLLTTVPHGWPLKLEGTGLQSNQVSRNTFPLPNLGKKLTDICYDIYDGRGFAILRGLDPDVYDIEDLTAVYLGVSSYIGERRGKQDQRGSMLMHVICRNDEDRDVRYTEDKPFHTDTVTDCLCLFTQSLAADGGRSVITSAWTVYNELASTRPDLIHVLAEGNWPFDTFGRNPSYYKRPLFFYHKEKLIASFSRRLLVGHEPYDKRTPGIPGLTEKQAEALDAVHFIGRKHEIKPLMEKGDLRFINNMGVLHRREAFQDSVARARHLVRIWLNNEMMCWKLPRELRVAWARVFEDDERESHWDIVPPREGGKVLRVAGTCD
ncbi:hypothetical protein JX265_001810 [Neoarthrinium moseri]|uniref:TauD/TfdA-like domain-containing protein n=1 Tax=Neoarthrinium moseri TaxID=1658444 RepID=A0A9Q0ATN4_9PEZI|nr:hypothetical protein JX265_001810 [Neoarthrinium moseri]